MKILCHTIAERNLDAREGRRKLLKKCFVP